MFDINELKKFGLDQKYPIIKDDSLNKLLDVVRTLNPKRILEIGTAIGYSGSLMLLNSNASLDTVEINKESFEKATKNFKDLGLEQRVRLHLGDASDVINSLKDEGVKYDLIFLDGAKGQYIKYLERLTNMLELNGVLVADNVLFRGYVRSDNPPKRYKTLVNNLRKFNDAILKDERLDTNILDIGDGVSISKKIKEGKL